MARPLTATSRRPYGPSAACRCAPHIGLFFLGAPLPSEPTRHSHRLPLTSMRAHQVWLVVRLCTDEDQVVEYWNEIDEHLEKEIDVIDDHAGEAAEVNGHNPWLTYGAPLHRLREWGSSAKVLDFLDERPLSRPELCQIVGLIWGRDAAATLPSPSDWSAFKGALAALIQRGGEVWDTLRNRRRPWISLSKVSKFFGTGGTCTLM